MSNIIDSIQLSGTTYQIQGSGGGVPENVFTAYTASTDSRIGEDEEVTAAALNALDEKIDSISGGGNPTVEVTQAEYDAMVSAGTVSADTYYIITDAQAGDLTNYYTKTETDNAITAATSGKVDTSDFNTYSASVETALSGKQDTLVSGTNIKTINNESLLGSGNIDIQGGGGGGKAVSGGTNISITTGETADTINCTLPFSYEGDNLKTTVSGNSFVGYFHYGQIFGINNTLQGRNSATGIEKNTTIIGYNNQSLRMENSIVIGSSNNLGNIFGVNNYNYIFGFSNTVTPGGTQNNIVNNNFVIGNNNTINKKINNFIFGYGIKPSNNDEFSLGKYNNSVSGSSTFGDSGNTLFSVGNGTADNARHNAFEIRQNGDIYLTLDGQDVKLQDQLGGSSITVDTALDSGSTNPVENRVIYNKIDEVEEVTAAGLNAVNDKFGGLKLVSLTQAEYNALATKDASTLYIIVN
ncbi:hypothetical protein [uncultured Methanobrevibacter sp.]|uniref:phage upper tail fiber protein n=1 Tax=uncultured Methanobrevibacter sp. TaxID=253161 RepID=UPI0025D7EA6E|nr:hypothetical protein [uncultured Methanobrevibacter sp.]